jgi:hypothetical protein
MTGTVTLSYFVAASLPDTDGSAAGDGGPDAHIRRTGQKRAGSGETKPTIDARLQDRQTTDRKVSVML